MSWQCDAVKKPSAECELVIRQYTDTLKDAIQQGIADIRAELAPLSNTVANLNKDHTRLSNHFYGNGKLGVLDEHKGLKRDVEELKEKTAKHPPRPDWVSQALANPKSTVTIIVAVLSAIGLGGGAGVNAWVDYKSQDQAKAIVAEMVKAGIVEVNIDNEKPEDNG